MNNEFDPCQYVWSQEMAIRRLLHILRYSQSYCTDNECLTEFPLGRVEDNGDSPLWYIFCWFFLAIILYVLRVATIPRRNEPTKPHNQDQDPNGGPPAPAELF